MSATSRLQRRGVRRRAGESPLTGKDPNTQGTCSYYSVDATGCRAPRTCYDCLNTDLENEQGGCMINEIGRCVSVAGNYDVSLDFRMVSAEAGGVASNGSSDTDSNEPPISHHITFQLEFSAVNTTYCEDGDTLFNENLLTKGGYMFGSGGCVFVTVCEIPSWVYVVGGSDCSGAISADYFGPSDDAHREDKDDKPQGYLVFWCVAIAIILTLVATLAMVITIRHHNKRRQEELRRRTIVVGEPIASASRTITPKPRKSGVQLLNLFGWEAMRADLIEQERQEMQERHCVHTCPIIDNSVPGISPSTNYLQLEGAHPSAPVILSVVPSAPRLTYS